MQMNQSISVANYGNRNTEYSSDMKNELQGIEQEPEAEIQ